MKKVMEILVIILSVLHGLLHLLGFAKAYDYNVPALSVDISKSKGLQWLAAAVFFFGSALMLAVGNDSWWILLIVSITISQYLIFANWNVAKFGTVANILLLIAAVTGGARYIYYQKYQNDVDKCLSYKSADTYDNLTEDDIAHLPEPVKKYIRYTGCSNKPKVKAFRIVFDGHLRQEKSSDWMSFTSQQYNFISHSARLFFLDATMYRLPVSGYHRYKDGRAYMDIRLLSLFRVEYQEGAEMDTAETVTYFNDMCCMAPATLIDERIKWLDVNDSIVKASFTGSNNITISAWLHFNKAGQLINFVSDDRYANTASGLKKLRWYTPLKNYKSYNGYMLASHADAIYVYPSGPFTYGDFELQQIQYNP